MCRSYCKAKKCHYKNQLDQMGEVKIESLGGIIDIEELVSWGTEKQVCPYYLGRQLTDKEFEVSNRQLYSTSSL